MKHTVNQKRDHVRCSKNDLQLFQCDPQNFGRFGNVDQTWKLCYLPENKNSIGLHQKNEDVSFSRESSSDYIFGIVSKHLNKYLTKSEAITDTHYTSLLNHLKTELLTKNQRLADKEVLQQLILLQVRSRIRWCWGANLSTTLPPSRFAYFGIQLSPLYKKIWLAGERI